MAARPKWRAFLRLVEERGGGQVILDRLEKGETAKVIAADYNTSPRRIYFWLMHDDERWLKYQAALLRRPGYNSYGSRMRKIIAFGGEPFVMRAIANGETLSSIARRIGIPRTNLMNWIDKTPHRKRRYEEARLNSAGALADEALDIIDNVDPSSSSAVQKAREQVNTRKWLASIHDRNTFGAQDATKLNVNIGAMHLNALLAYGGPQTPKLAPGRLEGEVVTEADLEFEKDDK